MVAFLISKETEVSERTVKNARRNLDTRIEVIRRGNQWYYSRISHQFILCLFTPYG